MYISSLYVYNMYFYLHFTYVLPQEDPGSLQLKTLGLVVD